MFVFKRRNGYYYVIYKDSNGISKRISTKTKIKSEATKFLTNFNNEIKIRNEKKVIPITLENFAFHILKRAELTNTWKSVLAKKTTFNMLKQHFDNNIQLEIITQNKLKEYLNIRIVNSSIYAARKDLINIRAAFNVAVEENYLQKNPCNGIKGFKIPEKQPLFFSKDEFNKLDNIIVDTNFNDLVNVAINTGMRQMELLMLKYDQINFDNKIIILNNRNHITKSKKIRSIPMNDKVYSILNRRSLSSANGYVFNYIETTEYLNISKIFKKYVKLAKLNEEYHFHTLRHTFASWLIQAGVNIYYVSKLLGHANIKTTEIYAHLKSDNFKDAVDKL